MCSCPKRPSTLQDIKCGCTAPVRKGHQSESTIHSSVCRWQVTSHIYLRAQCVDRHHPDCVSTTRHMYSRACTCGAHTYTREPKERCTSRAHVSARVLATFTTRVGASYVFSHGRRAYSTALCACRRSAITDAGTLPCGGGSAANNHSKRSRFVTAPRTFESEQRLGT